MFLDEYNAEKLFKNNWLVEFYLQQWETVFGKQWEGKHVDFDWARSTEMWWKLTGNSKSAKNLNVAVLRTFSSLDHYATLLRIRSENFSVVEKELL